MTKPARGDPWRNLALAILLRAARDAASRNGHSVEARRFLLFSRWCAFLCDHVDLDRRKLARWVLAQEPLTQLPLNLEN